MIITITADLLGTVQEIEISADYNMLYVQPRILENAVHKILWDFEIQTDNLIPARRPD